MRVAVTGARGRLGRALIDALEDAPFTGPLGPIAWSRPDLDLDTLTPGSVAALITRDRPELVIHAAAWTDVDGCAGDPVLATRRNGVAPGVIAESCADRGVAFALVSTNEVFDGTRTDGRGYRPDAERHAVNPYGASKLAAELRIETLGASHPGVGFAVIRTAWLHGPPGNDFPARICAAALRARAAGEPLRVVSDEIGTPTFAPDVADAIAELIAEDALVDTGRCAGRPPPGQHRSRVARRLGPRGAAGDGNRGRGGGRPSEHLAARLHATRVGRPGAHAPPVGGADARLARGLCPRRSGAGARALRSLTPPLPTTPVRAARRAGSKGPHRP